MAIILNTLSFLHEDLLLVLLFRLHEWQSQKIETEQIYRGELGVWSVYNSAIKQIIYLRSCNVINARSDLENERTWFRSLVQSWFFV